MSKGNPRLSGAGGLLISLDQLIVTSFSWGLGKMSNNQAESYNLLKAYLLAKEAGFKNLQVYGDSELLIKMLNSDGIFNTPALNIILKRIRNILKDFEQVEFFHILRYLNGLADSLANVACLLAQGHLSLNGEDIIFQSIP